MKLKLAVFDIEVLSNCFICCVLDVMTKEIVTYEISERVNDMEALVDLFTSNQYIFVGYNCIHYDSPVMSYLIRHRTKYRTWNILDITSALHTVSSNIIKGSDTAMGYSIYKYAKIFYQIDLLSMLFSQALRVSLKNMQVTMLYKNVQEMVVDWEKPIELDRIDELIEYCHNDVESTATLLRINKSELELRKNIEKEMQIECLSKDGVNIGVEILGKIYKERTGLDKKELMEMIKHRDEVIPIKDIILPFIKFETNQFKDTLEAFRKFVIRPNEEGFKHKFVHSGVEYSIALGGIHSVNRPELVVPDEDEDLIDIDVASLYPSAIINYGFYPRHLGNDFIEVYTDIRRDRLAAKKSGNKLRDAVLKLALNGAYGMFNNKYSWLYDPKATYSITVNNQLLIMMLSEKMALAGHKIVSVNTDGITLKVKKNRYENFKQICKEWEELTRFELEEVMYEKMAIYSVNEYVAYKKGYSEARDKIIHQSPAISIYDPKNELLALKNKYVKEKGFFITEPRLGKGLDCLIIGKALQDYFGKNIAPETTVRNSQHIWDFVRFEKTSKEFDVYWNDQVQQKTNRYYISRDGAYLFKGRLKETYNKKSGTMKRELVKQHMLKGFGVTLFNKYEERDINDYKINYSYYVSKVREIINQIEPKQISLF